MKKIFLLMAVALGASIASAQEQQTEADRLYLQIMQAYKAQNWEEVASLVQQVAQAGEDIEEFEVIYAQSLNSMGNYQQAFDRMDAYTSKYPEDYGAWSLYADLCARLGMNVKAVEAYEHCSSLHPEIARPLALSARLLRESDPVEATARYKQAIRMYKDGNRVGNAIQLGPEALGIAATDTELLMLLGECLEKASMPDDALPFYAEVVALNAKGEKPDVAQVAAAEFAIANIYYNKGEYDKTLDYLKGAIDNEALLSSDVSALAKIFCVASAASERLGMNEEAHAYEEKARAYDPDGADAVMQSLLVK